MKGKDVKSCDGLSISRTELAVALPAEMICWPLSSVNM